ncbi:MULTISPECIES: histidine kinase [Actinoplanes]|uniref:sensor histidine kinase n=1 Tax=Actinoplanes TaxID=1865 RepID=UPI000697552C|nr:MULTISPECIES: histidine kinase [Actinoplanes]
MNRYLLRAGQIAVLLTLAVIGAVDVASGMRSSFGPVQVLTAVAVTTVWLPHRPVGSRILPGAAIGVSLWSILLTLTMAASSDYTGGLWGLAETVSLLGMLVLVARNAPLRWAVPALVIGGLAVSAMPLRVGGSSVYVTFCLIQALGAAAAVGGGSILRSAENSRRRALDTVRAEQRAEFARDLHDFIAHHVTGIVVQAQGARFIAEQDPQRVLLALEQIEKAGAETMASMRRMVGVLRDSQSRPDAPLAPIAGVPELAVLIEQFGAAGAVTARLHVDGPVDGLPVEVSTSAYRVVMEALTNVRQHAPAATVVDVWLRRTPQNLLLRVADDGPAPKQQVPRDRPGYGLVGLTERVRAVGGHITAGPGVGGGWVVDAVLPLTLE